MTRYKNIQLREDGFDSEYIERKKRESKSRAARWTQLRYDFEDNNPTTTCLIYLLLAVSPLVALMAMIWRI